MRDVVDDPSAGGGGSLAVVSAGWASAPERPSLSGVFRTVAVPGGGAGTLRRLLAFAGPGFMVAVGYMDPGNWATDLAAGSGFGYRLLFVVVLSGLMAILLQALAAKLGIATGRDLAQACRDRFSPPVVFGLWILAELGICACDLAEVLGAALGLKLLFGAPLGLGVCLTLLDVVVVLALQRFGFRRLEALVVGLVALVGACLVAQLVMARPDAHAALRGLAPDPKVLGNRTALYIAVGVIGATIMPHNLYLHSSIVQTRRYRLTLPGRKDAVRLAGLDSALALGAATAVNAALVALAAATFHANGLTGVADITEAHHLLTPLLGAGAATLFAVALLASGQNSAVTATLAGQIVMEGFVRLRLAPWKRRLLTRSLAVVPAALAIALLGDAAVGKLLIGSQVVLALQLPFAVLPLVMVTGDRRKMGPFVNGPWTAAAAWTVGFVLVAMNVVLLAELARA